MAAMSARNAQEPRSVRPEPRRLTGKRAYAGDERRLDLLAVGLANRAEAHDGRDGGGDLGQNEGLKARFERQPMPRRSGGDRRGIGDVLLQGKLTQRLAIPGGASGDDKGGALSRGLQATFGRIGERDGELVCRSRGLPNLPPRRRESTPRTGGRRCAVCRTSRDRPANRRANGRLGCRRSPPAHSNPCE